MMANGTVTTGRLDAKRASRFRSMSPCSISGAGLPVSTATLGQPPGEKHGIVAFNDYGWILGTGSFGPWLWDGAAFALLANRIADPVVIDSVAGLNNSGKIAATLKSDDGLCERCCSHLSQASTDERPAGNIRRHSPHRRRHRGTIARRRKLGVLHRNPKAHKTEVNTS